MHARHATLFMVIVRLWIDTSTYAFAQTSDAPRMLTQVLESVPQSLDVHHSQFTEYQYIGDIRLNIERMYGVGCVLESPALDPHRSGPFPSKEWEYVPLIATETTTLREFLDHTCSDGKLQWSIVSNALHIRPATASPEVVPYLDTVKVSLELNEESLIDALRSWGLAVNKNRPAGSRGVRVIVPAAVPREKGSRATPISLSRKGAVTLKIENTTAREALCGIQGASREWASITFMNSTESFALVTLFCSEMELKATPRITADEREALNFQEGLNPIIMDPDAVNEETR